MGQLSWAAYTHTVKAFDFDLSELARKIVEMGGLVKQQIETATEAMRRHDLALAAQAAAADNRLMGHGAR